MLCFLHYSLCVCQNYYKTPFIVKALNTVKLYLKLALIAFILKKRGLFAVLIQDSLSHRTCRHYRPVYWFESAFQNTPFNQKLAFSSHWKDTTEYSALKFLNSMAWVLIIYLIYLSISRNILKNTWLWFL